MFCLMVWLPLLFPVVFDPRQVPSLGQLPCRALRGRAGGLTHTTEKNTRRPRAGLGEEGSSVGAVLFFAF